MVRMSLLALAITIVASSASAMTIAPLASAGLSDKVTNVAIVCDASGYCAQVGRRKPVARWVYGEGTFSGHYDGPRWYGSPRLHYGWWPHWWY